MGNASEMDTRVRDVGIAASANTDGLAGWPNFQRLGYSVQVHVKILDTVQQSRMNIFGKMLEKFFGFRYMQTTKAPTDNFNIVRSLWMNFPIVSGRAASSAARHRIDWFQATLWFPGVTPAR